MREFPTLNNIQKHRKVDVIGYVVNEPRDQRFNSEYLRIYEIIDGSVAMPVNVFVWAKQVEHFPIIQNKYDILYFQNCVVDLTQVGYRIKANSNFSTYSTFHVKVADDGMTLAKQDWIFPSSCRAAQLNQIVCDRADELFQYANTKFAEENNPALRELHLMHITFISDLKPLKAQYVLVKMYCDAIQVKNDTKERLTLRVTDYTRNYKLPVNPFTPDSLGPFGKYVLDVGITRDDKDLPDVDFEKAMNLKRGAMVRLRIKPFRTHECKLKATICHDDLSRLSAIEMDLNKLVPSSLTNKQSISFLELLQERYEIYTNNFFEKLASRDMLLRQIRWKKLHCQCELNEHIESIGIPLNARTSMVHDIINSNTPKLGLFKVCVRPIDFIPRNYIEFFNSETKEWRVWVLMEDADHTCIPVLFRGENFEKLLNDSKLTETQILQNDPKVLASLMFRLEKFWGNLYNLVHLKAPKWYDHAPQNTWLNLGIQRCKYQRHNSSEISNSQLDQYYYVGFGIQIKN